MKKEKVILSFVAILIGLLVAAVIFYLYQATKTISPNKITTIALKPTATPKPSLAPFFLSVDAPADQSVVSSMTLSVSGKTEPTATVVVITPVDQQIISPASSGDFSTTVTINNGENPIEITAIGTDGQETKVLKTVTFTTESF